MSGGSSEEKNLPPSEKKLREARRKGQIAKAPDLVTAATTVALLGYVFGAADWMAGRMRSAMLAAADLAVLPFDDACRLLLPTLGRIVVQTAGPALGVTVLAVVVSSVAANGGFLLTLEPLMPKLSHLDPIKGIGKLFALKSLVELLKSVVKAVVLGIVGVELALGAAGTLVQLPFCGPGCIGRTASGVLRPLVETACGLYLVSGGLDLMLQKWLFRRDMKMSTTEQKRERKDQDGDPHVRGAQRNIRREAASGTKLGLSRATIIIAGAGATLGLRYVRGETGLPTVVARSRDADSAAEMMASARRARMPVYWDNRLAVEMAAVMRAGQRIKPEFFQRVAEALYSSGAVNS